MTAKHRQLSELLIDVERSLRTMHLWSAERPDKNALTSQQPFCLDTLRFEQWLQFVFIERMTVLAEQELPLPTQCGLAPMAEEYFVGSSLDATELIRQLRQLDRALSSQALS